MGGVSLGLASGEDWHALQMPKHCASRTLGLHQRPFWSIRLSLQWKKRLLESRGETDELWDASKWSLMPVLPRLCPRYKGGLVAEPTGEGRGLF